nr:AsmA family protein [Breoghania corrubedonensis]
MTLILALVAALVAPVFIDWSAYRTTFEEYAGKALGHRVTVLGSADARLLPTPTLIFSDVRVGEAEDPLMVVSRFKVRVELPPLLTGKIQVVDMELDKPQLNVSLDESGRIDWLTAHVPASGSSLDPDDVQLEDVQVTDGSVRVVDARTGRTYRADDINLQVSARSLEGPFKADGSATIAGLRQSVRIATGRQGVDGIRIKADIQPTDIMATLQTDGVLSQKTGKPVYAGSYAVESVVQVDAGAGAQDTLEPQAKLWRSEGTFSLDPGSLEVDKGSFRYGPEDRAVRIEGEGRVAFGARPRFTARLAAKQIDLDRLFGAGPQDPVSIENGAGAVMAGIKSLPLPPIPGSFRLDLPALVAAGGLAQDIHLEAETLPRGWNVTALEARLPGQTIVSGKGELRVSDEPAFSGSLHLSCSQPSAFAAWWRRGQGGAPLALEPFSVSAHVEAAADGVALNGLEGKLGEAGIRGDVTWRAPTAQGRARVAANLEADRLDLDQLSALAGVLRGNKASGAGKAGRGLDTDVSVRLDAGTLVYSGVAANGVKVRASLAGDDLEVEQFSAADLAGAEISARGRIAKLTSAPDGSFETSVKASRVEGLVTMLKGLFPQNPLVDRLQAGGEALAPLDIAASITARAEGDDSSKVRMALAGDVGASKLDAAVDATGSVDRWRQAQVSANISLKAGEGVQLLGQLGLDVVPLPGMGRGSLTLRAEGRAADGLAVTLIGDGLGASASFDGSLSWPAGAEGADGPVYEGTLAFKSEDVAPIGMLAGRLLPMLDGEIPVDAKAKVTGVGGSASLGDVTARLGDVTLAGKLDAVLGEPARRISGDVRVSQVALARLSELLLGADAWSSVGGAADAGKASHWPGAPFGAPLMGDGTISLNVTSAAVDIGLERPMERAKFALQLRRDELAIDDLSGSFNGGKLVGSLLVKRSGAQAAVSGNLSLSGTALEDLVWRRNDRPVADGLLDAKVDFEGTGRSIAGLVAGLAGGGSFTIRDGEIRSINPAAFASVIHAADAGLDLKPEKIASVFESHLDAGALPFKRIDGTLVIAAGTARARNVTVDSPSATAFGSAQIDLDRWQLESDWSLKVDPGENAVTGAEAQVGVLFRGALDAPRREIDIQPFTAFLTLRAFEKEVRRVEDLQADINERDRLMREMRQLRRNEEKRQRVQEQQSEAAAEDARKAAEAAAAAKQKAVRERAAQEKAAREKAAADKAAREKAQEGAKQAVPVPAPEPGTDAGSSASTPKEPRAPLTMEEFIKRIRPAIDGGDKAASPGDDRSSVDPVPSTGDPMKLNGGLGAPIVIDPHPVAQADETASGPSDENTGSIGNSPAPQRTSPPTRERARPKVPRFITLPGTGSRVVPNPDYPGN